MTVTIDDAEWHEEDAGSSRRATYHIAVFLWWCAERGLAGPQIDVAAIAADPVTYTSRRCAGTLTTRDLGAEGAAFAAAHYRDYLIKVAAYAQGLGVATYALPEDAASSAELFAWLDARVGEERA